MKMMKKLSIVLLAGVFASGAALAKKPESPGNSDKHKPAHQQAEERSERHSNSYFDASARTSIQRYYSSQHSSGKCPPGLAKKNNGCRPPGATKHWKQGERLPRDVVYYDLPHALLHELGRTREGQKLIRVGTDILLINEATRTVIDAVNDLDDLF